MGVRHRLKGQFAKEGTFNAIPELFDNLTRKTVTAEQIKAYDSERTVKNVLITYKANIIDKDLNHKNNQDFYFLFKFPKSGIKESDVVRDLEKGKLMKGRVRDKINKFNKRYKGRVSIVEGTFKILKYNHRIPDVTGYRGVPVKPRSYF